MAMVSAAGTGVRFQKVTATPPEELIPNRWFPARGSSSCRRPAPFAGDGFDVFRDQQGRPALRVITLIPATRAEFEPVRGQGDGRALLGVWRSQGTDLLDSTGGRPC